IRFHFAEFLHGQFGEQTMAQHGWHPRTRDEDDAARDKSGTYALHTLSDDETIARLATGIKRFKLPDEFNFLKIYQQLATEKSQSAQEAPDAAPRILETRRQSPKAATAWRAAIQTHGPGQNNYRQQSLEQIVGNWGRFEGLQPQASGKNATVDFRFRNGKKVTFKARAIKVRELLEAVKAHIRNSPGQLDWNQINLADIGHRLVDQNQVQYLGEKVASWNLELKPRPGHVDDRVTVTTPLSKAGAYLLVATM